MKQKRFSAIALIVTAAVTLVCTVAAVALTAWLRLGPGGFALLESADLFRHRFVGTYDDEAVVDAALDAAVTALDDRWSFYLSAREYDDMLQRRRNRYVGIGLTYTVAPDSTYMDIVALIPGGPAEQAGLEAGWRITAIDGQNLTAENFTQLVDQIGQESGREIALTVLDADGQSRVVRLRAAQVQSQPVQYELLEDGLGYVRLENFYAGSAQLAEDAVDQLVAQGAKGLLFDVRANPGGYVSELTDLLDHLLGPGPIFTERSKNGPVRTVFSDEDRVDLPMAVLIDANSYSAAELFAAQLRESASAPLIGERTCGKGYYQQAFPLPNGGGLNLSTGMYATGAGVSLIGTGLVPDVEEAEPQAQMDKAVAALEERLG